MYQSLPRSHHWRTGRPGRAPIFSVHRRGALTRDFRDAKATAQALGDAWKAKDIDATDAEALELIAKAFGFENLNILSAKIPLAASIRILASA